MSKLGIHAIVDSTWATPFAEAGASVLKVVDNVPWARGLASAYPSTVVIERVYHPEQLSDIRREWPVPKTAALGYAKRYHFPYREFRPTGGAKTYIETVNEPVVNNSDEMRWYVAFSAEMARIHVSEGYGSVLGNFATGNPDTSLWSYVGEWANLWQNKDILLGLHEYGHWARLPGTGPDQDSWNMLRFKRVKERLWHLGYGSPRIVITETGLDEVGGYPEPAYQQWRTPNYSEEKFEAHLYAYDEWLMSDPDVLGATVFTYRGSWPGFDMESRASLNNRIIQHIRNTRSKNMLKLYTPALSPMGHVKLKVNLNVRSSPWITTAPPVIETLKAGAIVPYYDRLAKCGWLMLDIAGNRWVSGLTNYVEYI